MNPSSFIGPNAVKRTRAGQRAGQGRTRQGSYLDRPAQQPEAQPPKLARQFSAKPCGRMKLREPLGIVSLIGASNSRSRSVTTVFGVLQQPTCYGIVWGTTGADLHYGICKNKNDITSIREPSPRHCQDKNLTTCKLPHAITAAFAKTQTLPHASASHHRGISQDKNLTTSKVPHALLLGTAGRGKTVQCRRKRLVS